MKYSLKFILVLGLSIFFVKEALAQSYAIGELSITLNDPNRSNRSIPTQIYYPAVANGSGQPIAAGKFPVIVIGHGFSMTYDAYENFWEELVPRGFIVALPETESSTIPFPSHSEFGQDLSFIVDYLLGERSNPNSLVYNKISPKVAIMGHSMGGGSTFLAVQNNSNVTTIAVFAPAETNPSAVSAAANVTVPALVFAGSDDNVAPASDHSTPMYNTLSSDCKTYITINDGSHCQFAESNFACDFGETTVCIGCNFISRSQQHNTTFRFLNPWLSFFLKGECEGFDEFNNLLTSSTDVSYQQNCNIQKPVADFDVTGDTTFCLGDSVEFSAIGNYEFLWSNGDSLNIVTVGESGEYYLIARDDYNCADTSARQEIRVIELNQPNLLSSKSFEICQGDSITLYVDESFSTYEWQDQSQDSFLVIGEIGDYTVMVTDSFGCSVSSDTATISALPNPTVTLSYNDDNLTAITNASTIDWYLNNTLISGANGTSYVPDTTGSYYVSIQDSNGCTAESDPVLVMLTGLPLTHESQVLRVYPIPTKDLIFIESSASEVYLFDMRGQYIKRASNDGQRFALYVNDLASGIYYLRTTKGEVKKVVKN